MRKILDNQEGVTLVSVLVALVIITAISAIAVPSLIGMTDGGENGRAKMAVLDGMRMSNVEFMYGGEKYPSSSTLIESLNKRNPDVQYIAYGPSSESTGPSVVSIARESDIQISVCAKSNTGLVYCARDNAMGRLIVPEVQMAASPDQPSLLERIGPGVAYAAEAEQNDQTRSLCVGWSEENTRGCLASSLNPSHPSADTNTGWSGTPGDQATETEDISDDNSNPEPEPEPEPEPLDYQSAVNSHGPSAQCPFDETGTAYVNLQCQNINGQLQDQAPRFTTQKAGAILSDPNSKAVGFNGATHYSYGNPSNGSTNNQSNNWTAAIWAKSNVNSPNAGIVSADDNWAIQSAANNGFTCSMRLGNPWSVRQVTGGPAMVQGQWNFLACTYEAGTLKLFVNGYQVAATSGVPVGQSGNGNFRPGYVSSGWTGGSHFNGDIDQFNFFKKTLSGDDIHNLYKQAGY